MAQYRVPQDVEAEDKLLGPLTLKQFLFAMAFFGLLYLTYIIFLSNPFLSLITLPMLIVTGAFAFWQRKDQPVEVFFRSGILYYTKPHIRRWDQDGALKLVEVLAPRKIIKRFTDGRSQQEVKSQLTSLSQTLDTHGWNNRIALEDEDLQAERLVPLVETPVTTSVVDLRNYDEPEDLQAANSGVAQNVQQRIEDSGSERNNEIKQMMSAGIQQSNTSDIYDYSRLNQAIPELEDQPPLPTDPQSLQAEYQKAVKQQSETLPIDTAGKSDLPDITPATQINSNLATPLQTDPVISDKITQAESIGAISPKSSDELTEGTELDLT